MTPAKKREQRQEARRSRLKLLAEIDQLNTQRCDECKDKLKANATTDDYKCACPASKRILEIGKILQGAYEIKTGRTKSTIPKAAKPKTEKIKRKRGRPKGTHPPIGDTIKGINVEVYKDLKVKGKSDAEICKLHEIPQMNMYRWKRENELLRVTPKKVQESKEGVEEMKTMNDVIKENITAIEKPNVPVVIAKSKYDELQVKYDELASTSSSDISKLQQKVWELTDKNTTLVNKSSFYESDYRKLEVDYLNAETENKRLRGMLEKTNELRQLNVLLMKNTVEIVERVDEVAERWS